MPEKPKRIFIDSSKPNLEVLTVAEQAGIVKENTETVNNPKPINLNWK